MVAISISKLALGLPLIALSLHTVHGKESVPQTTKGAVAPANQVQPTKPLTPEDYFQPIDSWLKQNGSPLNGKDFYEVGKQYGIDPDFLIAVTKAETNLAKVQQRGSSCNVGSVGSYDSTNTTHSCTSQRQGIEMIAQTVTNGLLGKYDKVSQLSRAYNKTGHIYASSESNWHRNVTTTMNTLKGRNEQDYVYRIDVTTLP